MFNTTTGQQVGDVEITMSKQAHGPTFAGPAL
jgi:hypothetical protein